MTTESVDAAAIRRARIVQETALLFDQRGYHQASMDDIARAVGVRKPTLYHYFKSKEEILFWIHEEFIDLLMDRALDREAHTVMGADQALLELMGDILELMQTHRGHVRVFFEHHRELGEAYRKAIVSKRDRYQSLVEEIIRSGAAAGTFREVDPTLAALAVFGVCNWAYQWYRPDRGLTPRQVAYTFWDLMLHGMRPRENR
jgi:TetR/AcrR family transcriptional regulator, cholesterol catabolism regulator